MEPVAAEVDALARDPDAARRSPGARSALDYDYGMAGAGGAVRGPDSRGARSEYEEVCAQIAAANAIAGRPVKPSATRSPGRNSGVVNTRDLTLVPPSSATR